MESEAHSLELIECSLTKRDAINDDDDDDEDDEEDEDDETFVAKEDGLRCRSVFKSKFGWRLACLLQIQINKIRLRINKITCVFVCVMGE